MWGGNWRDEVWSNLEQPWDIIVIGGGITGAGVLREATRLGLRVLLVERKDFAWGTSSRSSKLVHGGLRYLKQLDLGLTWASVREREQLLEDGPGLIDPLGFLVAHRKGDSRWLTGAGLMLYDLMAKRWRHRHYSAEDFKMLAPRITWSGLKGGYHFEDAQTDDSRLVLRIIREAVAHGACAINYVSAEEVLRDGEQVTGLRLRDHVANRTMDVRARVVINATGVWAEELHGESQRSQSIRPLRGSHLIFSGWRLPVAQAVTFGHPIDGRYIFIVPWEGVTLVGTTDIDHKGDINREPRISHEEVAYLMAAVEYQYPSLKLTLDDVVATFAGVRPVIGTGKDDPSHESRDHIVWQDDGLLTVTGGKLTTFRLIALEVLKDIKHLLPHMPEPDDTQPVLDTVDVPLPAVSERMQRRLLGRYGNDAPALVGAAGEGELEHIAGTPYLWGELRWAARAEGVVHLHDLLLRRLRLGLLLEKGGADLLSHIRSICQPELGWDDAHWEAEAAAYLDLWQKHYSLPSHEMIPNWHILLARARLQQTVRHEQRSKRFWRGAALVALLLATLWRRRGGTV